MSRFTKVSLALVLVLTSACSKSRLPPEGTPIETSVRVWMLGEPGSSRFLAVVSPMTFWVEHLGPADLDRIMLEQTGHVFLCDAMTGSVTRLCSIPVPESVPGFLVELEGVRYRVIGWDADAAYFELRAEPTRLEGSYEPFAWYRAGKDGTCTVLNGRPTALVYGYDIPGFQRARGGRGYPFPGADDFWLVHTEETIVLTNDDEDVTLAKFTIDPVTYDIRAVDLGEDAKRLLREALERQASGKTPKREEWRYEHH